jgi:hypothetical protein
VNNLAAGTEAGPPHGMSLPPSIVWRPVERHNPRGLDSSPLRRIKFWGVPGAVRRSEVRAERALGLTAEENMASDLRL